MTQLLLRYQLVELMVLDSNHMVQMLTESMTTGLRHVLYVVATRDRVLHTVLIEFSLQQISAFVKTMERGTSILSPFKDLYTGQNIMSHTIIQDLRAKVAREYEGLISHTQFELLDSHFPKIAALRSYFFQNGRRPFRICIV